jgi:hypothetical protein
LRLPAFVRGSSAASIPYNFRTRTNLASSQAKIPDFIGAP